MVHGMIWRGMAFKRRWANGPCTILATTRKISKKIYAVSDNRGFFRQAVLNLILSFFLVFCENLSKQISRACFFPVLEPFVIGSENPSIRWQAGTRLSSTSTFVRHTILVLRLLFLQTIKLERFRCFCETSERFGRHQECLDKSPERPPCFIICNPNLISSLDFSSCSHHSSWSADQYLPNFVLCVA